jgi:hypothetical protein
VTTWGHILDAIVSRAYEQVGDDHAPGRWQERDARPRSAEDLHSSGPEPDRSRRQRYWRWRGIVLARPGRVDLAAELPLPDADARRALLRLYQGSLVLDGVDLDEVVERTNGSTAPFLRELLRKAALLAAEADLAAAAAGTGEAGRPDGAIRVTGAQLTAALDQLLDSRAQLTRVLLGGQPK